VFLVQTNMFLIGVISFDEFLFFVNGHIFIR
jgi:hypothetical protein